MNEYVFNCWKNISLTKNLIKGKNIFSFQINIIFEYYIKKNLIKKQILKNVADVYLQCNTVKLFFRINFW